MNLFIVQNSRSFVGWRLCVSFNQHKIAYDHLITTFKNFIYTSIVYKIDNSHVEGVFNGRIRKQIWGSACENEKNRGYLELFRKKKKWIIGIRYQEMIFYY